MDGEDLRDREQERATDGRDIQRRAASETSVHDVLAEPLRET